MHRSVQRFVLIILSSDERQSAFDEAVEMIYKELPKPSPIIVPLFEQRDLFTTYIPHAISILNAYKSSDKPLYPTIRFAEVICSAAAYLYEHGMAKQCLEVVATGEKVCKEISALQKSSSTIQTGLSQSSTIPLPTLEANIIAYGAGVLWTTGGLTNRKEAHDMTRRVLKLRENYMDSLLAANVTSNDRVLLSNAYNDWALQLINEGKYYEARDFSRRLLDIKEKYLDT